MGNVRSCIAFIEPGELFVVNRWGLDPKDLPGEPNSNLYASKYRGVVNIAPFHRFAAGQDDYAFVKLRYRCEYLFALLGTQFFSVSLTGVRPAVPTVKPTSPCNLKSYKARPFWFLIFEFQFLILVKNVMGFSLCG